MVGARWWHPTRFAPEGPARPREALPAARGGIAAQAPVQAHGTSSKIRCCFSPWERLTTEPPNSSQVARCKVPTKRFAHTREEPAPGPLVSGGKAMHPPLKRRGLAGPFL